MSFDFYRLSYVDVSGKVVKFVRGPIPQIGTELHIEAGGAIKQLKVTSVIFTLVESDTPDSLQTVKPLVIAEFI